jgi:hypothetical protein
LGGKEGLWFDDSLSKELVTAYFKTSQAWWYTSVIPATHEVEVGVLWFKASPRFCLKMKLKQKELGVWLK